MTGRRVVIAGLGDSGLLTAIHLARHAQVVGVSLTPAMVSGQELGLRLSDPDTWAQHYRVDFSRYRGLDRVETLHAEVVGLDPGAHTLTVRRPGSTRAGASIDTLPFDVLLIATGVRNGFWRHPELRSTEEVDEALRDAHIRVANARSIAVIGGGAAAVSAAAQLAARWPDTRVDLYHPGTEPLPRHHQRVRRAVVRRLGALGVVVHPGHRAVPPAPTCAPAITDAPIEWRTGQPPVTAAAVIWAIGAGRPNTEWLPPEMLTDDGFVRVGADLAVPGHPGIFAVGDVADTDPLRGSARNRADRLAAHNIRTHLDGGTPRRYRARNVRWGSVFGPLPDGLDVFTPQGARFRFPAWTVEAILYRWIVARGIYRGIRPEVSRTSAITSDRA
ncbi:MULTISPECIES: FAD-dependent oxidoreductase [unclassified Gordonia (in: high G+C Gram-positive bacteria)]